MRGRLVAVTQFKIVVGILLAFFSNLVEARLVWGPPSGVGCLVSRPCGPRCSFFSCSEPREFPLARIARPIDEAHAVLSRLGTDS